MTLSMEKKKGIRSKQPTFKGPWSRDEDEVVATLVGQYGPKRWSLIASNLPGEYFLLSGDNMVLMSVRFLLSCFSWIQKGTVRWRDRNVVVNITRTAV